MIIKAKNVSPIVPSMGFSEDKTKVIYNATFDLYVEGNPYSDLVTPKTVYALECPSNNVEGIQAVTETQVNEWIAINYPST